jgi:Uma2 family endonuclease
MTLATAKRFTLEEYHCLIDWGFFGENDRVELIRGEIIQMAAKGTAHAVCCTKLNRELLGILRDRATVRCQDPITLPSGSEPEPDFAIVQNQDNDYLFSHPTPQDTWLVIEIADSSLSYDRDVKLPLYAEAGIDRYWIVNLIDNQLETYSQPYQKHQSIFFDYSKKQVFLPHQTLALPGFADLAIDLPKVFPHTQAL